MSSATNVPEIERAMPESRWEQLRRRVFDITAAISLSIIALVLIAPYALVIVGSGQVGVLYSVFTGTRLGVPYGEGLHIKFPANAIFIYDTRIQTLKQTVQVLSFNGLAVDVTLTCRYRVVPDEAPLLHQQIGPEYVDKLISPVLLSSAREVIGNYRPEELYTTHSTTIQDEIDRVAQDAIQGFHIELLPVLVESLSLPAPVNTAIEEKLRMQQESQSYEFRLAREAQEVARMRLEGEGKREYNRLLNQDLTPAVLQYLGIEAIKTLATSENAKVVVVPTGDDHGLQMPISLWSDGSGSGSSSKSSSEAKPSANPGVEEPAADAAPELTPPKPPKTPNSPQKRDKR